MMRNWERTTKDHRRGSSVRALVSGCWRWLGLCTVRVTVLWGLVLAIGFEAVTCVFRFGLHMQSTRDTRALAAWTFGWRIHHGYPGVLFLLLAPLFQKGPGRTLLLLLGIGLMLSDLTHHVAVLWPLTGNPQFHIRYADLALPR